MNQSTPRWARPTNHTNGGFEFKIVGRYIYPEVESRYTHKSHMEATAELNQWKRDAKKCGQLFGGRVVAVRGSN